MNCVSLEAAGTAAPSFTRDFLEDGQLDAGEENELKWTSGALALGDMVSTTSFFAG
jgi:hypothetical protein